MKSMISMFDSMDECTQMGKKPTAKLRQALIYGMFGLNRNMDAVIKKKPVLKRLKNNIIRSKSVGNSPRGKTKNDKTCKNVKNINIVTPEKTISIQPTIFSTLTSASKKR